MSKRKAHYAQRIADQICEKIALGNSLKQALTLVGPLAPTLPTLWRWLDEYPLFKEKYDRARQMQADIHADTMLELAQEVIKTPSKASAIRVAADILQWQAGIRDSKKYGAKVQVTDAPKQLSPADLRKEIALLEKELGVKAVPGMNTAPNFTRRAEGEPADVPPAGESAPDPKSDAESAAADVQEDLEPDPSHGAAHLQFEPPEALQ